MCRDLVIGRARVKAPMCLIPQPRARASMSAMKVKTDGSTFSLAISSRAARTRSRRFGRRETGHGVPPRSCVRHCRRTWPSVCEKLGNIVVALVVALAGGEWAMQCSEKSCCPPLRGRPGGHAWLLTASGAVYCVPCEAGFLKFCVAQRNWHYTIVSADLS